MTWCQTFSNFLSTPNLIGSSDAPTVKGGQDWMMPTGVVQAVGLDLAHGARDEAGIWLNDPL